MKRVTIILFVVAIYSISAFPQGTVEKVLNEIEKNNTALATYRQKAETEKLYHHTGILPAGPNMEYGYIWGSPSELDNRQNFSITMSFDFPTSYKHKNRIADEQDMLSIMQYESKKKALLYVVKTLCVDIIYRNDLHNELLKRKRHAETIAESYRLQFKHGEVSIIEKTKADMLLLEATTALELNMVERKALMSSLTMLNGGVEIELNDTTFSLKELPEDFDIWYNMNKTNILQLQIADQHIELSILEEQLAKSMNLPDITTGYVQESIPGEDFRGVVFGLQIPLWENKNKVRMVQSQNVFAQSIANDLNVIYYQNMKTSYHKAVRLDSLVEKYEELLISINNVDLLKEALDSGEISLIEYVMELRLYYDSAIRLYEMKRDLAIAVDDLYQYL